MCLVETAQIKCAMKFQVREANTMVALYSIVHRSGFFPYGWYRNISLLVLSIQTNAVFSCSNKHNDHYVLDLFPSFLPLNLPPSLSSILHYQ